MTKRLVLKALLGLALACGAAGAARADDVLAKVKAAGAAELRFLAALAAPEGLAALARAHPDVRVTVGAVDDRLDGRGYILPGLGDAGDRLYGTDGAAP